MSTPSLCQAADGFVMHGADRLAFASIGRSRGGVGAGQAGVAAGRERSAGGAVAGAARFAREIGRVIALCGGCAAAKDAVRGGSVGATARAADRLCARFSKTAEKSPGGEETDRGRRLAGGDRRDVVGGGARAGGRGRALHRIRPMPMMRRSWMRSAADSIAASGRRYSPAETMRRRSVNGTALSATYRIAAAEHRSLEPLVGDRAVDRGQARTVGAGAGL